MSTNPRTGAWHRFLADVATRLDTPGATQGSSVNWSSVIAATRADLQAEDDEQADDLETATLRSVNSMTSAAYQGAWSQGRAAVAAALSSSEKDGTPADHDASLRALESTATRAWRPVVEQVA